MRNCIATGDVVAVVGELLSGCETRRLAHDLVTFDHQLTSICMCDHPLSAEKSHGAIGAIFDRNEIDKRVRFIRRQRRTAMVVGEFIEASREAWNGG